MSAHHGVRWPQLHRRTIHKPAGFHQIGATTGLDSVKEFGRCQNKWPAQAGFPDHNDRRNSALDMWMLG